MKMLTDLFSTDYGLMSIAVIAITLGMAVWFGAFFRRKMNEDAEKARVADSFLRSVDAGKP